MSWGERSCSQTNVPKNVDGTCRLASIETCHVDCVFYTWDGITEPDSKKRFKGNIFNMTKSRDYFTEKIRREKQILKYGIENANINK